MIQTHVELKEWIGQDKTVWNFCKRQCYKLQAIIEAFEKEDYTSGLYRGQETKLFNDHQISVAMFCKNSTSQFIRKAKNMTLYVNENHHLVKW